MRRKLTNWYTRNKEKQKRTGRTRSQKDSDGNKVKLFQGSTVTGNEADWAWSRLKNGREGRKRGGPHMIHLRVTSLVESPKKKPSGGTGTRKGGFDRGRLRGEGGGGGVKLVPKFSKLAPQKSTNLKTPRWKQYGKVEAKELLPAIILRRGNVRKYGGMTARGGVIDDQLRKRVPNGFWRQICNGGSNQKKQNRKLTKVGCACEHWERVWAKRGWKERRGVNRITRRRGGKPKLLKSRNERTER